MRQRFEFRVILGLLIWIGILSGGIMLARNSLQRAPDAMSQLGAYVANQRHTAEVNFPFPVVMCVGDPVFLTGIEEYSPIGFVSRVGKTDSTSKLITYTDMAAVTFYGSAPQFGNTGHLEYHHAEDTSAWVMKTMLTPEKRKEISKLIMDAYTKNQAEVVSVLRPVIEKSLQQASVIIKDDLKAAFSKRNERFRQIGQKYQSELIEDEIVPLIQDEIWPIIQEECTPLATQVGQEVWHEVSVFRFGWRYLYDRSPLPEKKLAEREFNRFVEDKAVPILKSHIAEFVGLQQKVIQRVSQNENVKQTFSKSVRTLVNDPEVQTIFTEVFQEVFLDNNRLQKAVEDHWKSDEARDAVQLASKKIEPTVTEIGAALFGSPRGKITPEFARVLRHRILHKDSRWLLLNVGSGAQSSTRVGSLPSTIDLKVAAEFGEIPYAPARSRGKKAATSVDQKSGGENE